MKRLISAFMALLFISLCGCKGSVSEYSDFASLPNSAEQVKEELKEQAAAAEPQAAEDKKEAENRESGNASNVGGRIPQKSEATKSDYKEKTCSSGEAAFPLQGFYGRDREIFVKRDYDSFAAGEPIARPQDAIAYTGEGFIRLKPFSGKISLPEELTGNGMPQSIPIKYYIYNSRVYSYVDTDWQTTPHASMTPIPGSTSEILLWGPIVLDPLIYNIEKNTYRRLYKGDVSYDVCYPTLVSDGGKYVATVKNGETAVYTIVNLETLEQTELPEIHYNKELYEPVEIIPGVFDGDSLILRYLLTLKENGTRQAKFYRFNIEEKSLELMSGGMLDAHPVFGNINYPEVLFGSTLQPDGLFNILEAFNMKTGVGYYHVYDIKNLGYHLVGETSPSGRYFLGYAYNVNSPDQPQICDILVDMEAGASTIISGVYEEYNLKYEGYNLGTTQWVSESELLVSYHKGRECYCEIIKICAFQVF